MSEYEPHEPSDGIPEANIPEQKDLPPGLQHAGSASSEVVRHTPDTPQGPLAWDEAVMPESAEGSLAQGAAGERSGFLNFRQPFDGTQPEIPLADLKAAGALFSSFFFESRKAREIDEAIIEDETAPVSVFFLDTLRAVNQPVVLACQMNEDGSTRESVEYRLCQDGLVRRTDNPPKESEISIAIELMPRNNTAGISPEQAEDERLENEKLENRFGLRDQPVGLRETEQLITALKPFV
jgi:hypothetical protein